MLMKSKNLQKKIFLYIVLISSKCCVRIIFFPLYGMYIRSSPADRLSLIPYFKFHYIHSVIYNINPLFYTICCRQSKYKNYFLSNYK
jgi:hypothetical protein